MCVCVCVCLSNPNVPAGCDTKLNFKPNSKVLKSGFSISYTGFNTKVKSGRLFTHTRRRNSLIHSFLKIINVKCKQSRPGFELGSPCLFPARIPLTPQGPSMVYVCVYIYIYIYLYIYIYILMQCQNIINIWMAVPFINALQLLIRYI